MGHVRREEKCMQYFGGGSLKENLSIDVTVML